MTQHDHRWQHPLFVFATRLPLGHFRKFQRIGKYFWATGCARETGYRTREFRKWCWGEFRSGCNCSAAIPVVEASFGDRCAS